MPLPEGITVEEMRVVYAQNSDSCDPNNLGQDLEIETADAGGGPYLVIRTERWAMELGEAEAMLTAIIRDFKKRYGTSHKT